MAIYREQNMSDHSWTPMIGLRCAVTTVAIRLPIAVVGWALCLWLAAPVLNFLTMSLAIFAMIVIVMLAPGAAIGHGLSRGVTDAAGMVGLTVAFIVVAGVWLSVWIGMEIATMLRPIGDWQLGFAQMATGTWASLWAIKAAVFEH